MVLKDHTDEPKSWDDVLTEMAKRGHNLKIEGHSWELSRGCATPAATGPLHTITQLQDPRVPNNQILILALRDQWAKKKKWANLITIMCLHPLICNCCTFFDFCTNCFINTR